MPQSERISLCGFFFALNEKSPRETNGAMNISAFCIGKITKSCKIRYAANCDNGNSLSFCA
ncbi:MAG TPA: hypothetical protein DEQ68_05890 [Ruminococcaceae bacterium]|nr:hypothetical protein [Oscillospiraceae bacterium]